MSNISKFIQLAQQVVDEYWTDDILKSFFKDDTLKAGFDYNKCFEPFKVFSNFGEQLKNFKEINKEALKGLIKKTYIIDVLASIQQLTCEGYTYTTFIKREKPFVKMDGLWHPSLDINTVVKNNLTCEKNIILTGPNAGGKSTILKSVLLNIVLSQSFGIGCSDKLTLTPFKNISSQINVPDDKGHSSLFESEMYRCKSNLDCLKMMNLDQFSFIVFDELLNSTNIVEGIAGAYAIMKQISNFKNCLSILSTHYTYLTRLSKEYPDDFKSLMVSVTMCEGKFVYPYKLISGVSKQYIALELLKSNGFDKDIIENALVIKNKLLHKTAVKIVEIN